MSGLPALPRCQSVACNKPEPPWAPFKKCAKCHTTKCCSRECQKEDWKSHKKICGKEAGEEEEQRGGMSAFSQSPLSSLFQIDLHQLSERDTYGHLIDCYRMRAEDDYNFAGDGHGIYDDDSALPDFRKFLNLAEKRNGLLPVWWNGGKRKECEKLATDGGQWYSIACPVEKSDIMEHYNDTTKPMSLRLTAEKVYGCRINGGL